MSKYHQGSLLSMSTLSIELREKAIEAGFASVGISSPETLQDLPYGWIRDLRRLDTPEDDLQTVKSVIVLVWQSRRSSKDPLE
jgi:hypothetical protein